MDAVVVEGVVVALALGGAGFCSGASVALSDLERRGADSFEEDDDEVSPGVLRAFSWWRERRRSVSMVLALGHRLGLITAVVLGAFMIGGFSQLEAAPLVGLVAAMTLVVAIVTDVIPGIVARSKPQRYALTALRILRLPYLMLYPITKSLLAFRDAGIELLGEPKTGDDTPQGRARLLLRRLLDDGESPLSVRRRLMRSVVEAPGTLVREVMVPRTDMVTISADMELDEILVVLLECGHSRIPVHGKTLDDIKGLFYAKDIIQLMASGRDFDIDEFLRQPYFVPETKPISELLSTFQQQQVHLAVVVDEFGGTAGLITLEDIIEEYFGDIQDEYDVEPAQLIEVSSTTVLADARIGIDEIEEFFDVDFPRQDEYDSLGGFLLDQCGSVPSIGEEIRWESLLFRVLEASDKRIDSVEIERSKSNPEESTELVS